MATEIWAAYVTGGFSLLIAIYAANKAHAAEAASKLNDHVRAKALQAVEELGCALGRILLATRAQLRVLEAGGFATSEDFLAMHQQLHGKSVQEAIDAYFRTRVYWTDEMSANLESLVRLLTHVKEDVEHFKEREQLLSAASNDLVTYARVNLLRRTLPQLADEKEYAV